MNHEKYIFACHRVFAGDRGYTAEQNRASVSEVEVSNANLAS